MEYPVGGAANQWADSEPPPEFTPETHCANRSPRVNSLCVTAFRNYGAKTIECEAPLVVLTGANGVGKTNLLEALSLLAPGRGLRRAAIAEFQLQEFSAAMVPSLVAGLQGASQPWSISAELTCATGDYQIGTGLDPSGGEVQKRLVYLDGKPQKGQAILNELLAVIWLTPQLDRIFLEGSSTRRAWFDRIVASLLGDHPKQLKAYEQAMRERMRLLRDGHQDGQWFAALESIMASQAVAIAAARNTVLEGLNRSIRSRPETIFGTPQIAIVGAVEEQLLQTSARLVEESLRQDYAAARVNDRVTGSCSIGIHRSEIMVSDAKRGISAAMTSTGEQKSLLLAIFIAEAHLIFEMRGEPPLVLLDDLPAHFDQNRLASLHRILSALGGQIWLTGTNRADFASLDSQALWIGL
ncbi:MAG: DNA replication/repair protein RecF [Candidatus Pacebacteria bacterium]|nr:DNA replication/repair protein RecF [Candidatus Paceibacterota bacterium]